MFNISSDEETSIIECMIKDNENEASTVEDIATSNGAKTKVLWTTRQRKMTNTSRYSPH